MSILIKSRVGLTCGLMALITGCAATIEVHDDAGNETKGVPIRSPVLVEISTTTEYEIDPAKDQTDPTNIALCEPTTVISTSFMPLGDVFYVSYKPAWVGKSEFAVEYGDNGGVKKLAVNSDPSTTVDSLSNLLGAVLPYSALKAPVAPASMAVSGDLETRRKETCITKSTNIDSVKRLKIEPAS